MATTKPAHDDYAYPDDEPQRPPMQRETSIVAHIVRSIGITMSTSEMDVLLGSFGKHSSELSATELMVQQELIASVENLR